MSSLIDKSKYRQAILMRQIGEWHIAVLLLKAAYGVK